MKITQAKLKKGKTEKVCWVRARRGKLVSGMMVRMPDGSVWIVDEVYSTEDAGNVHNSHNSGDMKKKTDV